MNEKYGVELMSAEGEVVVLILQKNTTVPNYTNTDWVSEHTATYGNDPNFLMKYGR